MPRRKNPDAVDVVTQAWEDELREKAQDHTNDAIDTLHDVMSDAEGQKGSTRIAAANSMIKHGHAVASGREASVMAAIANASINITVNKFGRDEDEVEHFTIDTPEFDEAEFLEVAAPEIVEGEFDHMPSVISGELTPDYMTPTGAVVEPATPLPEPLAFPVDEPAGDWLEEES